MDEYICNKCGVEYNHPPFRGQCNYCEDGVVEKKPPSSDVQVKWLAFVGWYNDASQDVPSFDPGLDSLCPFCLTYLSKDMVTISLMKDGDNKSYFYRADKVCYSGADEKEINDLESSIIDTI